MLNFRRKIEKSLKSQLKRGKSILLLGARQTGKTSMVSQLSSELMISLLLPQERQKYEKNPALLTKELELIAKKTKKPPLIIIDEIQKVPSLLDPIQHCIDHKLALFILTGSSARKLRRHSDVNLLPGRLVTLRMDPLIQEELESGFEDAPPIEDSLFDGTLPGIRVYPGPQDHDMDLRSYVETYLEEEVRTEALVRNLGLFSRFLELAALQSGQIVNFSAIAQELGLSSHTIQNYYEILEDCLIAERIDPITQNASRKKLTKSSRYLIFDLGVKRLCAHEARNHSRPFMGTLFEQWVGLELIRLCRIEQPDFRVKFWRDPDGPEVDWVLESSQRWIPIEVKWTEHPTAKDTKHLQTFMQEYPKARKAYVICQAQRPFQIASNILALPWRNLPQAFT